MNSRKIVTIFFLSIFGMTESKMCKLYTFYLGTDLFLFIFDKNQTAQHFVVLC